MTVHPIGADHLERTAGLAVRLTLRMYDAAFAQLAHPSAHHGCRALSRG
ncbi:hypothetical protein ACIBF6_35580 [Streptosporangium amethystogenes]